MAALGVMHSVSARRGPSVVLDHHRPRLLAESPLSGILLSILISEIWARYCETVLQHRQHSQILIGHKHDFSNDILRFTFLSAAYALVHSGLRLASLLCIAPFDLRWFIPYPRPHPQLRSIHHLAAKRTEVRPSVRQTVFHQMVYDT